MTPAIADQRIEGIVPGRPADRPRLTAFQRWAWKAFGRRAERGRPDDALERALLQAHSNLSVSEQIATVYAGTVAGGGASAVAGAGVAEFLLRFEAPPIAIGVALLVAFVGTALCYLALSLDPASRASARGRDIDRHLSSSVNFVSAMSCADVRVDEIFRELAEQPLYGEIAEEAAWISRDTDLLGVDILTALRQAARRTPSRRFQEFLQGVVATAESGGELKPYFLAKSEQYEREGQLASQQGLERMGAFAEAFVTVAVAFPLFLIIILAVFAMIEGANAALITLLWATVLGLIPVTQLAFGLVSHALSERL